MPSRLSNQTMYECGMKYEQRGLAPLCPFYIIDFYPMYSRLFVYLNKNKSGTICGHIKNSFVPGFWIVDVKMHWLFAPGVLIVIQMHEKKNLDEKK